MGQSEFEISQKIQLSGPKHKCFLLRNNSGAFKDYTGRLVRFGLGNVSANHAEVMKSSDLIGITEVTITPEMVGKKLGVFTAIEVKREDWKQSQNNKREIAQQNFINWVKLRGGLATFMSDPSDLENFVLKG